METLLRVVSVLADDTDGPSASDVASLRKRRKEAKEAKEDGKRRLSLARRRKRAKSEAPASEAPANEVPASEVPASGAPASEASANAAPANEAPTPTETAANETQQRIQPLQQPASAKYQALLWVRNMKDELVRFYLIPMAFLQRNGLVTMESFITDMERNPLSNGPKYDQFFRALGVDPSHMLRHSNLVSSVITYETRLQNHNFVWIRTRGDRTVFYTIPAPLMSTTLDKNRILQCLNGNCRAHAPMLAKRLLILGVHAMPFLHGVEIGEIVRSCEA